ncbi:MAG: hypothetical protein O3C69_06120 [Chloroflexi bacterium]|nr:hypothetical protein [Chloroflexota bacterium]
MGLIDTGFAMFRPSALSAMQGHGFAPGGLVAALSRSSDRFRWRRWVASFMVLCMLAVSLLMPAVSAEGQTDGGVVVRVVDGTTGLPVDAGVPVMTVVLSDGIEISRWSAVTNGDGELRVPSQSPGQLTLAISATYEGASYARRFDVQDGEPVELTVYQVMPADQLDITERMALILEPGDAPGGINIKQFVRFENAGTRAAVYGAGGLLLPVPAAMSNLSVESDLSPDTPFGLVDEQGRSLGLEPAASRPRHVALETHVSPGSGTVVLNYQVNVAVGTMELSFFLARPVEEFVVLVPADSSLGIGAGEPRMESIAGVEYRSWDLGKRVAGSDVSITVSGALSPGNPGFLSGTAVRWIAVGSITVPGLAALLYAMTRRRRGSASTH